MVLPQDDWRLKMVQDILAVQNLRFPMTAVARALEYNRGNVSAVVRGKKPMSDTFFSAFVQCYGSSDDKKVLAKYLNSNKVSQVERRQADVKYITSIQKVHKRLEALINANQKELADLRQRVALLESTLTQANLLKKKTALETSHKVRY